MTFDRSKAAPSTTCTCTPHCSTAWVRSTSWAFIRSLRRRQMRRLRSAHRARCCGRQARSSTWHRLPLRVLLGGSLTFNSLAARRPLAAPTPPLQVQHPHRRGRLERGAAVRCVCSWPPAAAAVVIHARNFAFRLHHMCCAPQRHRESRAACRCMSHVTHMSHTCHTHVTHMSHTCHTLCRGRAAVDGCLRCR